MAITRESIIKPNSLSFNQAIIKASKIALNKIERKITLYVLTCKDESEHMKELELENLAEEMVEHYIKYINFYTREEDPDLLIFNDNIDYYREDITFHQKEVLRDLIYNIWYN